MQYGFLKCWVHENATLLEKKIIKTVEQFEDQWRFELLSSPHFLQINLDATDSYIFLTTGNELPYSPTKDALSFQKHLGGSQIQSIEMDEKDRIIYLTLFKTDMYQEKTIFRLIIELIPSHQNMILTRFREGKEIVVESLKKYSLAENPHRQVLPGAIYMSPPVFNLSDAGDMLEYPLSITDAGKLIHSESGSYQNINEVLEKLFYEFRMTKKKSDLQKNLIKRINTELSKIERKIAKQEVELESAKDEIVWYQYAELLKANFTELKTGMSIFRTKNYFADTIPEIDIPLQANKTPRANLDHYLRKYRKAKNGRVIIEENIASGNARLNDLKNEIRQIEKCDSYLELQANVGKDKAKSARQEKTTFRHLPISENWEILIGRSSKENDLLTLHTAKPNDWWFHTRIFQGTHVVLRNFHKLEIPEHLLILCARLAAYYSKAKSSSQVPVDYTQIRYVRKPRGSAPGFVTYSHQKTIFVDPISIRDAINAVQTCETERKV